MKTNTEPKKEQAPKSKTPKSKSEAAPKPAKEPADRLPTTIDDLKDGKAGLTTYLLLTGKGKDEIAAELKEAVKVSDSQAAKIVRRIDGRLRFFQRALALVAAK